MLTSGISSGTLRTCMPCRTTGLGWSMDNTCAPSWTSVEVKLDDWDCLSLSLGSGNVLVYDNNNNRETNRDNDGNKNHYLLNWILITTSSRSKCVGSLYTCRTERCS